MKTMIYSKIVTIFTATILCVCFLSCSSDDSPSSSETTADVIEQDGILNVNVKDAGTFPSLIGDFRKYSTQKLKVSGPLNGTDIRYIREMMMTVNGGRLEYLNMADADIVTGGDWYMGDSNAWEPGDSVYITKNNIISSGMFEDCDAIQELILPNSVVRISYYAFGEKNIRSITIGRSTIGSLDFSGKGYNRLDWLHWSRLEEINIHPENSYYAAENGIMYNKDKTILYRVPPHYMGSLSFPTTLQTVGSGAFGDYEAPTITLPISVRNLESGAFSSCKIKHIDISSFSELESEIFRSSDVESVILSPALTFIPYGAFHGCGKLQEITIPASVNYIGEKAFDGCDNLHDIYLNCSTPPYVDTNERGIFSVFSPFPVIHIPHGTMLSYASSSPWDKLFPWNGVVSEDSQYIIDDL